MTEEQKLKALIMAILKVNRLYAKPEMIVREADEIIALARGGP